MKSFVKVALVMSGIVLAFHTPSMAGDCYRVHANPNPKMIPDSICLNALSTRSVPFGLELTAQILWHSNGNEVGNSYTFSLEKMRQRGDRILAKGTAKWNESEISKALTLEVSLNQSGEIQFVDNIILDVATSYFDDDRDREVVINHQVNYQPFATRGDYVCKGFDVVLGQFSSTVILRTSLKTEMGEVPAGSYAAKRSNHGVEVDVSGFIFGEVGCDPIHSQTLSIDYARSNGMTVIGAGVYGAGGHIELLRAQSVCQRVH